MRGMRLLIGLGALVALVALFLVFRPADDEERVAGAGTTSTTVTAPPTLEPIGSGTATSTVSDDVRLDVTIRGGEPVDGIVRAEAHKGDPVVVVVRSDVADHVHVHGYDLIADVAPGKPARMQFRASLTGRFEIELEDRGKQIAQLTVLP